jgi:hypothetical protein
LPWKYKTRKNRLIENISPLLFLFGEEEENIPNGMGRCWRGVWLCISITYSSSTHTVTPHHPLRWLGKKKGPAIVVMEEEEK